ncbi:hypothetical protein [Archangium sp.]|uniref:hypothetical protein n=1 Tax=Archangium sp. TaxID=1872627 RepID=UPI00286A6EE4|nr:hypothetical protein [Archangium sp.]
MSRVRRFLAGIVVGALVLLPVVLFEVGLSVPLKTWFYLVYGGFWGLVLTLLALRYSRSGAAWALPLLLLGLAILHGGQWSSRKVFLQHLERIEPGMDVAVVESILNAYPSIVSLEGSAEVRAYHHSQETRFDSDVGLVRLEGGRVTAVHFYPD